jgi:hypothetical protein
MTDDKLFEGCNVVTFQSNLADLQRVESKIITKHRIQWAGSRSMRQRLIELDKAGQLPEDEDVMCWHQLLSVYVDDVEAMREPGRLRRQTVREARRREAKPEPSDLADLARIREIISGLASCQGTAASPHDVLAEAWYVLSDALMLVHPRGLSMEQERSVDLVRAVAESLDRVFLLTVTGRRRVAEAGTDRDLNNLEIPFLPTYRWKIKWNPTITRSLVTNREGVHTKEVWKETLTAQEFVAARLNQAFETASPKDRPGVLPRLWRETQLQLPAEGTPRQAPGFSRHLAQTRNRDTFFLARKNIAKMKAYDLALHAADLLAWTFAFEPKRA